MGTHKYWLRATVDKDTRKQSHLLSSKFTQNHTYQYNCFHSNLPSYAGLTANTDSALTYILAQAYDFYTLMLRVHSLIPLEPFVLGTFNREYPNGR